MPKYVEMRKKRVNQAEVDINAEYIELTYLNDCDNLFFNWLQIFCKKSKVSFTWNQRKHLFVINTYDFYRLQVCLKQTDRFCQRCFNGQYSTYVFTDIKNNIDLLNSTYGSNLSSNKIDDHIGIDATTRIRLLSICESTATVSERLACFFNQNSGRAAVIRAMIAKIKDNKMTLLKLHEYIDKGLQDMVVVQKSSSLTKLRNDLLRELNLVLDGYRLQAGYHRHNSQEVGVTPRTFGF